MKTIKRVITFLLIILVLTSCSKEEKYEVDQSTSLKGTIKISPIKKDGETKYISILELEKPISINGTVTDKIEIESENSLKDNTETTITGTLKNNDGDSTLSYSIVVDSIDNILSYINNFSNDIFSFAIPAKLMKSVIVKEVNDGFVITNSSKIELFRLIALDNDEYKKLSSDDVNYERIKSNKKYTIVIIYPVEDNEIEELDKIAREIDHIKSSVKLK